MKSRSPAVPRLPLTQEAFRWVYKHLTGIPDSERHYRERIRKRVGALRTDRPLRVQKGYSVARAALDDLCLIAPRYSNRTETTVQPRVVERTLGRLEDLYETTRRRTEGKPVEEGLWEFVEEALPEISAHLHPYTYRGRAAALHDRVFRIPVEPRGNDSEWCPVAVACGRELAPALGYLPVSNCGSWDGPIARLTEGVRKRLGLTKTALADCLAESSPRTPDSWRQNLTRWTKAYKPGDQLPSLPTLESLREFAVAASSLLARAELNVFAWYLTLDEAEQASYLRTYVSKHGGTLRHGPREAAHQVARFAHIHGGISTGRFFRGLYVARTVQAMCFGQQKQTLRGLYGLALERWRAPEADRRFTELLDRYREVCTARFPRINPTPRCGGSTRQRMHE